MPGRSGYRRRYIGRSTSACAEEMRSHEEHCCVRFIPPTDCGGLPCRAEGAIAMTTEEARRFLQSVFDRLFDPAASAEDVGAFFSPDYVQDVDGRRLERGEFLNHVRVLKSTLDSATVTFKEIAADGATIADIHVVEARKKNGDRVRVKVM